ncbi:MAG: TerB family tellurite resistance protein [SAR324 cluster bacterium]|nr:TerB family tellurite resistance protein [SAR324 cluster bacterium]
MAKISVPDLHIIVKGAIHMAQQDKKVVPEEMGLIRKIIEVGMLDPKEYSDMTAPLNEDITDLAQQISSDKAKKVFLLTLFAIAYADKEFDKSEQELLDNLSKKLGVGKIKMDDHTMQACEAEVMKLILAV